MCETLPWSQRFFFKFFFAKRERASREEVRVARKEKKKFQEKPLGQGSEAIFYLKNLKFTGLEILLSLFRL